MYMIGQTLTSLPLELQYNKDYNYIDYIRIENGIYDDLYATHINENVKLSNEFIVPEKWDAETYFHAKFNGDLYSGNSDFGVENTTNIIIKRRELGTFKWFPMINRPVSSSDDYNFNEYDLYAASGTTYEYAAVPIVNGVEGTYSIASCDVKFDELIIIDKDESYSTMYDIDITQEKNNTSSIVLPFGAKYPIYVANAANDYYIGQVSATFLNLGCDNTNPSIHEIVRFRKNILDFLNNRKIKYIKDPFGRCWIASIGTTISDEDNGHPYAHKISFDFTEVGNIDSNEDMNKFGFLKIGEEWWI